MTTPFDRLVATYIKIREAREAKKREFDAQDAEFVRNLTKLETALLGSLQSQGLTSVRTEHGTVYTQIDVKPRVDDWDQVYAFIRAHDAFEALERRIKKTFVQEHIEAHGAAPPGVSVFSETVVRVRRS